MLQRQTLPGLPEAGAERLADTLEALEERRVRESDPPQNPVPVSYCYPKRFSLPAKQAPCDGLCGSFPQSVVAYYWFSFYMWNYRKLQGGRATVGG